MKHLILFIGAFLVSCASTQKTVEFTPSTFANTITAEELKEHLYIYASDAFMGRETGTEGETIAINYLKGEYESLGVKGGMHNGDYFMPMSLNVSRESRTIDCNNVLAFIEGSEKPDEVLVITAHLDHLGVENGQINNGADDDGSGNVAILEIAEAFKEAVKQGHRPKRSI